jgi:hypothetical protein
MTNVLPEEFNVLEAIDSAFNMNADAGAAVISATPLLSTRNRNELLCRMHESDLIDGIFQRNAADELLIAVPTRLKSEGQRVLFEAIRSRAMLQVRFVDRLASMSESSLETFFMSQGLGDAFRGPPKGWGKQKRVNEALALAKKQGRLDSVLEDAATRFFGEFSDSSAPPSHAAVPVIPIKVEPDYVFVLMPFGESWSRSAYEMLKEAARRTANSKYVRMERADDIATPGHITLQIEDAIRRSGAIVADITSVVVDEEGRPHPNPNVMWELGYAHACGKKTVIINQDPNQSPFDMLDLRQVKYSVPCSSDEIEAITRHLDEALGKRE